MFSQVSLKQWLVSFYSGTLIMQVNPYRIHKVHISAFGKELQKTMCTSQKFTVWGWVGVSDLVRYPKPYQGSRRKAL